jgi:hypothetical protein
MYEHRTQHLPTALIQSSTTVIHTKAATLRSLLTLHLQSVLAGRLPPGLLPPGAAREDGKEDRKLLSGSASFTQNLKLPRARRKQELPHDLHLREVPHAECDAVEFGPRAKLRRAGTLQPLHALQGAFLLVPGLHGTTTVVVVVSVAVRAGAAPASGARAALDEKKAGRVGTMVSTGKPHPSCTRAPPFYHIPP